MSYASGHRKGEEEATLNLAWNPPALPAAQDGPGAEHRLADSGLLLVGLRLIKQIKTGLRAETCHSPRALWGSYPLGDFFLLPFKDKKMGTLKQQLTCPRSQNCPLVEPSETHVTLLHDQRSFCCHLLLCSLRRM